MFSFCGFSEIDLYGYLGVLSIVLFLLGNLYRIREKKLCYVFGRLAEKGSGITPLKITVLLIIEIFLLSFVQGYYVGLFNTQFGNLVGTGANYYGLMICSPILIVILSLILRSNPLSQLDFITPTYPLALVTTKIACFCCGCCTGIPWPYGYLNYYGKLVEFPVQMVESLVAFILFLFMRWYQKRGKAGTCFPVYLITYSAIRFFTEFLRCEENIFSILNLYQIICLCGVAVGLIYFLLVHLFGLRIMRYYEEKLPSSIGLTNTPKTESEIISKKATKYLISFVIIILMLLVIFGNFLISHPMLFAACIAVSFAIFVSLHKTLFTDIALWKLAVFAAYFLFSALIIAFISPLNDSGHFNHISAYGMILAIPVFMIPLRYLGIPYKTLLSMSVLCECLLIMIRKAICMAKECCLGQYLTSVRFEFPSSMAELTAVALLFIAILLVMRKRKTNASIYAWFTLTFGIIQFLLLGFRYESKPSFWNVSNGYAWPAILIVLSVLCLITTHVHHRYTSKNQSCKHEV